MKKSSPEWYEKHYSFRLTKEDVDLYDYLENSGQNSRSKVIREMLLFALEHMSKDNLTLRLLEEMSTMKQEQKKNHQELINKLNEEVIPTEQTPKQPVEEVSSNDANKIVEDSANAMFDAFGVDFG